MLSLATVNSKWCLALAREVKVRESKKIGRAATNCGDTFSRN